MLALKTVLAAHDRIPVLVFDEIDANVGGEIARVVGRKLAALGATRQILCITHLPQVASCAAAQFVVRKEIRGERTYTSIAPVEGEARVDEPQVQRGFDAAEVFGEGLDLLAPDLVAEEELPVEVRFGNDVEIGQHQFRHARAHEVRGGVGAEAAGAGHADAGGREDALLFGGEVGVRHGNALPPQPPATIRKASSRPPSESARPERSSPGAYVSPFHSTTLCAAGTPFSSRNAATVAAFVSVFSPCQTICMFRFLRRNCPDQVLRVFLRPGRHPPPGHPDE